LFDLVDFDSVFETFDEDDEHNKFFITALCKIYFLIYPMVVNYANVAIDFLPVTSAK
jgi:hypothetical protein